MASDGQATVMIESNLCDFIRNWQLCQRIGGGLQFSTLVQMPSGSVLNLSIRPSGDRWIVSDVGAAIEEACAAGIDKPVFGMNIRRAIRSKGLVMKDGRIESPTVTKDALQAASIAVANTSRDIAEALIYVGRDEREYSLNSRARQILVGKFHTWVSAKPVIIRGESEKEHKFDTALILPDGRKVLIDAVNHHAHSINSVVVANMDVRHLRDDSIVQRIVFDPSEPWKPEEISLLEVGAQPVALPQLAKSVEKVAA
jgi:hypothetical protein